MKKLYFISVVTLIMLIGNTFNTFAQAPEGITYQAEARDGKGVLLINKSLTVKTIILLGSPGNRVWEMDYAVTTDMYGMFTLTIGKLGSGTPIYGDFPEIKWDNGAYFLNVKIFHKSNWINTGTTQLLSVPYALFAKTAGSAGTETDPVVKSMIGIVKSNGSTISAAVSGSDYLAPGQAVMAVSGTLPIVSGGGTTPAISITAATTSDAGSMSAADKTKLDGIAPNANNYIHPAGDGNLHVPVTGTTNIGKVLTAGSTAGSFSWASVPSAPVTSVAGRTGDVVLTKADVGLGNVENTALSSWPGTTNLTTLGTITTGSWNASPVSITKGGTGATTKAVAFDALSPMTLAGDLIYGGPGGSGERLAAGSAGQFLKMSAGATAPEWSSQTLVNFTESNYSFNSGTGVSLLVTNAASDVDLVISPKGSGSIQAQPSNGTNAGGDNRGVMSVDLQMSRVSPSQVASGAYSAVIGGSRNTANADYSFVGGGFTNTASGTRAAIVGGSTNTANGNYSFVGAGYGNTAASYGESVFGLYASNYTPSRTDYPISTDRLFVVGNGTADASRSNAFTILKNANTTLGGSLTINGNGTSYSFPTDRGATGQLLKTNADGTTSWASAGSFETDPVWTSASTNYYTKTNMQTSDGAQLHFNNLTSKPTTMAGYGITDAMSTTHAANAITSTNITYWNTAYGWGNHAGLYRPVSYIPAWSEITSNPFSIFTPSDNQLLKYNSTSSRWENWTPNYLTSVTGTGPIVSSGGTTPAISITAATTSAAGSMSAADKTKLDGIAAGAEVNVNADWSAVTGVAQILHKPDLSVYATKNMNNQNITNLANPVNAQDAATKAYVDKLESKVSALENMLINAGLYTLSDADGNTYHTVKIGDQVWMKENLKTRMLNDGTDIPMVTDNSDWSYLTTPGYCWYNNDQPNYGNTYGALYNWYTVNTGKLCPVGWHVPSDAEWTTLTTFLGGVDFAGVKMKETGTTHWESPNSFATNESGFSGLPGGYRIYGGSFEGVGSYGFWWSSTESSTESAWRRTLLSGGPVVSLGRYYKVGGFSVRCVRDN